MGTGWRQRAQLADSCHSPGVSSRRPDLGSGRKSAIVKDEGILFKAEEELV